MTIYWAPSVNQLYRQTVLVKKVQITTILQIRNLRGLPALMTCPKAQRAHFFLSGLLAFFSPINTCSQKEGLTISHPSFNDMPNVFVLVIYFK